VEKRSPRNWWNVWEDVRGGIVDLLNARKVLGRSLGKVYPGADSCAGGKAPIEGLRKEGGGLLRRCFSCNDSRTLRNENVPERLGRRGLLQKVSEIRA